MKVEPAVTVRYRDKRWNAKAISPVQALAPDFLYTTHHDLIWRLIRADESASVSLMERRVCTGGAPGWTVSRHTL